MDPDHVVVQRGPLRLPKLAPVALAAVLGVMAAEWIPSLGAPVWCLLLALALVGFATRPYRMALLLVIAAAFGLAHALNRAEQAVFPLAGSLARGRPVEIKATGLVEDAPAGGPASLRFPLRLDSLQVDGKTWILGARLMVRWRPPAGHPGAPPRCGDRVEITGRLAAAAPPRNPGQFDAANWLRREGIVAELQAHGLLVKKPAAGLPLKRAAVAVKEWLAAAITFDLADRPAESALIKALVLGSREDMAEEMDAAFRQSGTLHIFSVSGLHVGLVAVILWRLLNLLRFSRRQAALASIPLIFFYALVTGWHSAALRAALMASTVLLGICLNRPTAFFNTLCLAALIILAHDSHQLFLAGTQLSFVVIGCIAAGGPPVADWMKARVRPDPFLPRKLWPRHLLWSLLGWRWLAQMLAVSLAAALGSSPLTLWHFQLATPASLAANLVHVPLAGLILATAGLSACVLTLCPWLAAVLNNANFFFAQGCLLTAGWFAQIPGGSVAWNPRLLNQPPQAGQITIFDLGEGGAALIQTPHGKSWLIDTGTPAALKNIVLPGLAYQAVANLDGLVLSHGDRDHVGGAGEAVLRLSPDLLGHPLPASRSPGLRTALQLGRQIAHPLVADQKLVLDEVTTLSVLWPPASAQPPLADDGCLVLLLECAGRKLLFSNDAGFLAERSLSLTHPDLKPDVWIRGRHASDLSGHEDFLKKLSPSVVVCAAAGTPPSSQLPPAWRTMAEALGCRVLDQQQTGAVRLTLHPDGRLHTHAFLTAPSE